MALNKEIATNKKTLRIFFILVFISLVFIFARLTNTVIALKYLAMSAITPTIQFASNSFSDTNKLTHNIVDIVNVNRENINLKTQLFNLNYQLTDFESLKEENDRLKNILSLPKRRGEEKIVANIITREPSSWYQWVLINKGLNDNIEVDLPVICLLQNQKICVFGRVTEVFESSSKVALITNSLFCLPAQIKRLNIDCLTNGFNNPNLTLSFVDENSKIVIGDEIVTSKLSNIFDKEIAIGQVTNIVRTPSGNIETIFVLPYSQTEKISEVIILKKEK